jgi:hypothetical protein
MPTAANSPRTSAPASSDVLAADVVPVTPGDELVRRVLMLGICGFYAVGLAFLAVMWLAFGHTDLKDIVLGGFLGVSNLAAAVAAYYFGTKTQTDATRPTVYRVKQTKQAKG